MLESLRNQTPKTQADVLELLLTAYHRLSTLLARTNQNEQTRATAEKALATAEKLAVLDAANSTYQLNLAEAYLEWGDKGTDVTSQKLAHFTHSAEIARQLSAANPNNARFLVPIIRAEDRIGRLYLRIGNENCQDKKATQTAYQKALLHCRMLLALTEKRAILEPENYIARRSIIVAQINLSEALRANNQSDEALSYANKGLAGMQKIAASDSHNIEAQTDLTEVMQTVGECYMATGKISLALEKLRAAQQILEGLIARDPNNEELKMLLKKLMAKVKYPLKINGAC